MKEVMIALIFIEAIIIVLLIALIALYIKRNKNVAHIPLKFRRKYRVKKKYLDKKKIYILANKNFNMNKTKEDKKLILFFHGGAYIANINKDHWAFCGNILDRTNSILLVPDYPLLPIKNYSDVYNFCDKFYDEALNYARKNNIKKENIIFMGDSAGGSIAIALAMKCGKENKYVPEKVIAISPWLDARLENEKIIEVQKDDLILNYKSLRILAQFYANFENLKNYLISPINGDVTVLKNIIIFSGTKDILYPDVCEFRDKLNEYKVNSKVIVKEDKEHIWLIFKDNWQSNEFEMLISEIER